MGGWRVDGIACGHFVPPPPFLYDHEGMLVHWTEFVSLCLTRALSMPIVLAEVEPSAQPILNVSNIGEGNAPRDKALDVYVEIYEVVEVPTGDKVCATN